eukprot:COSAG01_NODE_10334_length_2191_cov_1.728967_1_plen_315_part_10
MSPCKQLTRPCLFVRILGWRFHIRWQRRCLKCLQHNRWAEKSAANNSSAAEGYRAEPEQVKKLLKLLNEFEVYRQVTEAGDESLFSKYFTEKKVFPLHLWMGKMWEEKPLAPIQPSRDKLERRVEALGSAEETKETLDQVKDEELVEYILKKQEDKYPNFGALLGWQSNWHVATDERSGYSESVKDEDLVEELEAFFNRTDVLWDFLADLQKQEIKQFWEYVPDWLEKLLVNVPAKDVDVHANNNVAPADPRATHLATQRQTFASGSKADDIFATRNPLHRRSTMASSVMQPTEGNEEQQLSTSREFCHMCKCCK